MKDFPRGSRIKAVLTGVVLMSDENEVTVTEVFGRRHANLGGIPHDAVTQVIPPIQTRGARVYVRTFGESMVVVLHDPESATYVLRRATGKLITVPDDDGIEPTDGATDRVTPAPEAPPAEPAPAPIAEATCAECGGVGDDHLDTCSDVMPF